MGLELYAPATFDGYIGCLFYLLSSKSHNFVAPCLLGLFEFLLTVSVFLISLSLAPLIFKLVRLFPLCVISITVFIIHIGPFMCLSRVLVALLKQVTELRES